MSVKIRKILLVEDNPGDVRLMEEALKRYGNDEFKLWNVSCFQNALEKLERQAFDVILLDLFLPDVDGLEGVFRASRAYPLVPLIAMSSFYDEKMACFALQMGAKAYLPKSDLKWEELLETLRILTKGPKAGAVAV